MTTIGSILQKKCSEYHSILASIHDKVTPIFVKSERTSSRYDELNYCAGH